MNRLCVWSLVLLIGFVGCSGDKGKDSGGPGTADGGGGGRTLKPMSELKVPEGLKDPVTELKLPKSSWEMVAQAQVGDFVELEMGDGALRTRSEVFDMAEGGMVQVIDTTVKTGDQETKSKSATKMLFTEPDLEPTHPGYVKSDKKPSNRKFTIGGKEITADQEWHSFNKDGKLISKSWFSKQVPLGMLLTEDGDGKVVMRVVNFGRK